MIIYQGKGENIRTSKAKTLETKKSAELLCDLNLLVSQRMLDNHLVDEQETGATEMIFIIIGASKQQRSLKENCKKMDTYIQNQ